MTVKTPHAIYEECSVHGRAKPKHGSVKELLFLKQLLIGPHFQGRKNSIEPHFSTFEQSWFVCHKGRGQVSEDKID